MIEYCKHLYGLSAPVMKEVFTKRIVKYNLRNCRVTLLAYSKTEKYGNDTVAYQAVSYKNLLSLDLFKSEIKDWHCSD